MKHIFSLFFALSFLFNTQAQTKAIPPFEPEQYVRSIIQELDIPDDTFEQMRGKNYVVPLKLFLNEKGTVVQVSIPNDEYKLEPLITPICCFFTRFSTCDYRWSSQKQYGQFAFFTQ